MQPKSLRFCALVAPVAVLALAACRKDPVVAECPPCPPEKPCPAPPPAPTAADAKRFVDDVNKELKRLWARAATGDWIKNTHITDDTERNAAALNEDVMAYLSKAIAESAKFEGLKDLDADTARAIHLLKLAAPVIAPNDPQKREELTNLMAKLEGMYGKAKSCRTGKDGKEECRDLGALEKVVDQSRDYDQLLDAWKSWHDTAKDMRPMYERVVTLANEGAKELGFENVGDMWRAGYDMPAADC